jgi:hypothetical protein
MSHQLPTNSHDLALWLCDTLEDVGAIDGALTGRLPDSYDFGRVVAQIEQVNDKLSGLHEAAERKIVFYPTAAGVYLSLSQMLGVASNRKQVPSKFTILDPRYTHPAAAGVDAPPEVIHYIEVVRLWSMLKSLSDISDDNNAIFVVSHDSILEIRPEYSADHLRRLTSLPEFAAEFVSSTMHSDQKRSIFRSSLVDHFKPRRQISLSEVVPKFEAISNDVRRTYAMYMAEFSYQKIRGEVERQNLDDTLRLNKTLADIQNQLLALPAAILLAGATVSKDANLRNLAVLAGMWVFCVLIILLVRNQRHSVQAISEEIKLRRGKIGKLPDNVRNDLLPMFTSLEVRADRQRRTLSFVMLVVVAIVALATIAVLQINNVISLSEIIARVNELPLGRQAD